MGNHPNRRRLGSEIAVTDALIQIGFARVAIDSRGGFVIVWQDEQDLLRARQNTHKGNVAGPILSIPMDGSHLFAAVPRVGASADGSFVVAWTEYGRVVARRYSSAGVPLDPDITPSENVVRDTDGFPPVRE